MRELVVEKEFMYRGLPCFCTINALGIRCGYVGVDKTHPWCEVDFKDEGPNNVQCHWGLTFSNYIDKFGDCWFFGFNAGHATDGIDVEAVKKYELVTDGQQLQILQSTARLQNKRGVTIKDADFIEGICKLIAEQLVRVR